MRMTLDGPEYDVTEAGAPLASLAAELDARGEPYTRDVESLTWYGYRFTEQSGCLDSTRDRLFLVCESATYDNGVQVMRRAHPAGAPRRPSPIG